MNSRRFVRFVGERQSWFLDATRRTTKKLQKCSSQSSSGTSGRGLRDCEGWSVKARKAKRLHFGGEMFGSCRCENLRESESYWLWAWTGLRIFQMCVGDLRSTKSGVFLKCTRTRLNSIQGWTVSKSSFHYQGDYQELLGCLLCASFQDLAMRHLVPALGRYDCALDYWCTLSLVSSTELLRRTVLLQARQQPSQCVSLGRVPSSHRMSQDVTGRLSCMQVSFVRISLWVL